MKPNRFRLRALTAGLAFLGWVLIGQAEATEILFWGDPIFVTNYTVENLTRWTPAQTVPLLTGLSDPRPVPIQVVRPIGRDPWNWGMFEMITTIAPHVTQSSPYELRGLLIFDRQEGKSVGESAADGIGALILDNQFYLGLNTPTVASTSIDLTGLTGSTHIDMMLWLLPLEAIGPGVPIYDARYYEFDVIHTTPEPGTLVLAGSGLGLVGWRLRRRLG